MSFSRFDRTLEGSAVRSSGERPNVDMIFAVLSARHRVTNAWSIGLDVPVGTVEVSSLVGMPAQRLQGVGDVAINAEADLAAALGWRSIVLRGSTTLRLPTAEHDAFNAVTAELPPNLRSTGIASWAIQGRLTAGFCLRDDVLLSAYGGALRPLSRTDSGLRFGTLYEVGAQLAWRPTAWMAVAARLDAQHRARADELGVGPVLSSGGDTVAPELSVALSPRDDLTFVVGGRLPIYQRVNQTQTAETFGLTAGIAVHFGGEDPDRERPAAKAAEAAEELPREEVAPRGPDVKALRRGGASFTLADAAVPGKVTVVDFWAEWCVPCKKLSSLLVELAGRSPRLAVRTVEVPTFDTPVGQAHLDPARGLPVLWILSPTGQRLEVLHADRPQRMMERVAHWLDAAD